MPIRNLTPFGIQLRKIRLDRREISKEMASKLGITAAYISAIEMGKNNIPDDLIEKLAAEYSLSEDEIYQLEWAKLENEKKVLVELAEDSEKNPEMYKIAFFMKQGLKQLSKEKLLKILEILNF